MWLTKDGRQPVDEAEETPVVCVLDGLAQLLRVDCKVAIVLANILGFGVFSGVLVLFFFFFKRRYERKVRLKMHRLARGRIIFFGSDQAQIYRRLIG